ncbi:MAG: hypothetical protein IKE75_06065 [Bacilli bacterium]|nr:hypothetical protein [Bacilli bacterium]
MKEDRNCGYPIYPTMGIPGPLPIGAINMPMPINGPTTYSNTNYDSNLSNKIASLEQRVTNLENMLTNSSYSSTSYNTTNYQMM